MIPSQREIRDVAQLSSRTIRLNINLNEFSSIDNIIEEKIQTINGIQKNLITNFDSFKFL